MSYKKIKNIDLKLIMDLEETRAIIKEAWWAWIKVIPIINFR